MMKNIILTFSMLILSNLAHAEDEATRFNNFILAEEDIKREEQEKKPPLYLSYDDDSSLTIKQENAKTFLTVYDELVRIFNETYKTNDRASTCSLIHKMNRSFVNNAVYEKEINEMLDVENAYQKQWDEIRVNIKNTKDYCYDKELKAR